MRFAVVDASVLVAFYVADGPCRAAATQRLAVGDQLFAPAHLDAGVVSALCGLARKVPALGVAVPGALRHLAGFPIKRVPLAPLMGRMWELRDNITPGAAADEAGCPAVRAAVRE